MNAVLDATLRLLARDGIGAVSFAAVAERAGVSRTTLYRRWPTRSALVRAAVLHVAEPIALAVERAIARGELPRGTDPTLIVTPIVATVLYRSARGEDLADVERVVELVIAGAQAGAAVRQDPQRNARSTT